MFKLIVFGFKVGLCGMWNARPNEELGREREKERQRERVRHTDM